MHQGFEMNFDEAAAFARNWIDDWNRADLDAVLAHYADNVTFRSPYVSKVLAGKTAVVGKEELREYWSAGIRRAKLFFRFKEIILDSEANLLAIIYEATIAEKNHDACEIMRFNPAGLVSSSEAYYGVQST
jgi:ketosteroid isomerase-like protein